MVVTCDFKPLTPLLTLRLVSPLTEFSRLVRSVQYAGLLLLQPASVTTVAAATVAMAKGTRTQVPPWRARDLPGLGLILIVIEVYSDTRTRHRPERVIHGQETAGDSG